MSIVWRLLSTLDQKQPTNGTIFEARLLRCKGANILRHQKGRHFPLSLCTFYPFFNPQSPSKRSREKGWT